jgi:SAD/SRA domain-containing protein/HNH endonuclease
MAGIAGSESEGADSIVLSGGYEDDEDLGEEIVYAGHGGRDWGGGRQVAHFRPLGAPHYGPDTPDNILCLCPNHHVLFDHGGVAVAEDHSLLGAEGHLTVHPAHKLNKEHLRYHREHYWDDL